MADAPQGVIAMFIDERGHVVATVNDFDGGGAAGFSRKDNQRVRATSGLGLAVARKYCSPAFVRGISNYEADNIVRTLTSEHGCRIHIETIGYEDEE